MAHPVHWSMHQSASCRAGMEAGQVCVAPVLHCCGQCFYLPISARLKKAGCTAFVLAPVCSSVPLRCLVAPLLAFFMAGCPAVVQSDLSCNPAPASPGCAWGRICSLGSGLSCIRKGVAWQGHRRLFLKQHFPVFLVQAFGKIQWRLFAVWWQKRLQPLPASNPTAGIW